jgi:hypothetical protein
MPEFYIQRQSIKKNPGGFMEQTKKAHAVFSFLSSCRHRFYPFRLIILRQGWPYKRFNLEKITLPLAFKPSLSLKRVF